MDYGVTVISITIGFILIVLATLIIKCLAKYAPIWKGSTTCRECGVQMEEEYPNSIGARRWWRCPACDNYDSYIDSDIVARFKKNDT